MSSPYVGTYSGEIVHLLDINQSEINLHSIVHALANQCRFNGHTKSFFSVAQHTLLVHQIMKSYTLAKKDLLLGLLHDASEAYLSDIPAPLKKILPDYTGVEKRVQKVIEERFNLGNKTLIQQKQVDVADDASFQIEAYMLMDTTNWVGYTFDLSLVNKWIGEYREIAGMGVDKAKKELYDFIIEYS